MKSNSICLPAFLTIACSAALTTASAQVVYVGPSQIPIQETNFGYHSQYKVLRLGLDQSNRALALGVDPSVISGGNFAGHGQILIGNKGILAPNAAGNDWMAVLRASGGKVFLGGSLSNGEVAGDALVVSGGNVGIGAEPNFPLTVGGGGQLVGGNPTLSLRETDVAHSDYDIQVNDGKFLIYDVNDSRTSFQQRFVIDASGNVGIGTSSPGHRLDVNGVTRMRDTHYYGSADEVGMISWGSIGGGVGFGIIARGGRALSLGANDAWDRLIINTAGNVGIGTTNPTQKLSVNGTVRAKEVIVEASPWPDDVFEDGYRLMALGDVEAHIAEHRHLPGVPNAATVAEQGVAVGEMQKTLLRKLEEMTLYMLQQQKEIQELKARIAQLEEAK